MLLILLGSFCGAFILVGASIPPIVRWTVRRGLVDLPGGRKDHPHPVPLGGGLAVAGSFLLLAAAVMGLAALDADLPPEIATFLAGIAQQTSRLVVFLCGGIVILLLGFADDRAPLTPMVKLVVEILVAVGFVVGVERLELFATGGPVSDIAASVVTVCWIVLVTNAFNLLDHFDGLVGGATVIITVALTIPAVQTGQFMIAAALTALAGGSAAFLIYNFPPAKVYLGDAGSLFIGYTIAGLTVVFTFYEERYPVHAYLVPLVVLAVPLFDTMSVVLLRLRRGKPVFVGDRNHFAHRLADLGLPPSRALAVVYAVTLCTGLSAFLLYLVDVVGALLIVAEVVLLLLIVHVFLSISETEGGAR